MDKMAKSDILFGVQVSFDTIVESQKWRVNVWREYEYEHTYHTSPCDTIIPCDSVSLRKLGTWHTSNDTITEQTQDTVLPCI